MLSELRFQSLLSRVVIRGRLTLVTSLHIGSTHAQVMARETDAAVIKEAGGKPLIPGSSFKGALRATAERIVDVLDSSEIRTCYGGISGSGCYSVSKEIQKRVNDKLERDAKDQSELLLLFEDEETGLIQENSCTTCRLFGSPFLGSKVQIKDLQWLAQGTEDPQTLFRVRDGVSIDRDTDTAADQRKFDFEVVDPSALFDLEIMVENPSPSELGLLFVALGQFEGRDGDGGQRLPGAVALGGRKSRGLGRVDVLMERIEIMDEKGALLDGPPKEARLLQFLMTGTGTALTGAAISRFRTRMLEAFRTSMG